ncbi:MAG: ATP-grasp domain-containing protein [Planctomycetes bacterium]|nr:ATP-grasp domain-containing protein [Planctomycetota bacterium]
MLRCAGMPNSLPRVLLVMPTMWDRRQLEACRQDWHERFVVEFGVPGDDECRADFPVLDYIDRMARRTDIAGVFSSSDYPGATISAAIATQAGLPGPDPRAVLCASHKIASRQVQQAAVPQATARFCTVDPDSPDTPEIGFPCFVKPVKGAFSMFSRRINTPAELRAHLDRPEVREFRQGFMLPFNTLWQRYGGKGVDGSYFIAEEVLAGAQVTVEGFVADDEPQMIGVVDTEFYPGTTSFSRFVYPSSLPAEAQRQMNDIARKCIAALGLKRSFFNIEMSWDGRRAHIIEVNPRICGQFADLHGKVDGVNTMALALDLVTGADVAWTPGGGDFKFAASVPLRVFAPTLFVEAPDADRLADLMARFPATLAWAEITAGQMVDDFVFEDGASFRYSVFNLGANSRAEMNARQRDITTALGFALRAL